jgi:hypothetical protein
MRHHPHAAEGHHDDGHHVDEHHDSDEEPHITEVEWTND